MTRRCTLPARTYGTRDTDWRYAPMLNTTRGTLAPEQEQLAKAIIDAAGTAAAWGFGRAASLAKLRAHPERLALFLSGRETEITPVNLEVWPSLTCNARCAACPYIRNLARREADRAAGNALLMSLGLYRKLAHEFRAVGGLSVNLTGGGEPTLHPELPEFGRIAREAGLDWGLFSNGYALTPRTVDALLVNAPTWIRLSINSWSPDSHDRVYRLGPGAYETVRNNLVYLAAHAPTTTAVGIGYIFRAMPASALRAHLAGIAGFVQSVVREAKRLDYVAVRPSVLYYADGDPLPTQPLAEQFRHIPAVCDDVLRTVCADLGVALVLNSDGFEALANRTPPGPCLATPWATSATEAGRLYLLSEANGSPHPKLAQLSYGRITEDQGFADIWNSEGRRKLSAEFADGARSAPALHKLSGLDGALRALRDGFGVVHPETARRVAAALEPLPKPEHWTFI